MTQKEMASIFEKVIEECSFLRDQGQKEYARKEEDALSNFKRVGNWLDIPAEKVLLVYALKHLDGIMSWVDGHKSQREDVRGRINDMIVYLILLRGFVEEDSAEQMEI